MSITINSKEYKIIKEIGKGGFSKVYKVKNENKEYAPKQIPLDNKKDEEKIRREAKILSNIDNNEYIVKYYDSYKDEKSFYILMEYCEGIDLRELIEKYKNEGKLMDEQLIYSIVLDICLGIKEIHKNNIIHRDLKPENIFRLNNNKIKIGDFGVAKQLDQNKKSANSMYGTLNYVAPELLKGKYNNKVDIWSLGCIIYELLTLNYCFENIIDLCDKIYSNKRYGEININKYNNKWQVLIDLLLKKDYNERPTIDEVINFLNKEFKNKSKIEEIKEYNLNDLIYLIITVLALLFLSCLLSRSSKTLKKNKK